MSKLVYALNWIGYTEFHESFPKIKNRNQDPHELRMNLLKSDVKITTFPILILSSFHCKILTNLRDEKKEKNHFTKNKQFDF